MERERKKGRQPNFKTEWEGDKFGPNLQSCCRSSGVTGDREAQLMMRDGIESDGNGFTPVVDEGDCRS